MAIDLVWQATAGPLSWARTLCCDVPLPSICAKNIPQSVGFCQEIMAYSPFPEGHDSHVNLEGHFRVILFKQGHQGHRGQHLQPTWPRSKFSLENFRAQHEMKTLAEKKVRIAPQKPSEIAIEPMKPKAFSSGGWIWQGQGLHIDIAPTYPRIFARLKASQTIKDMVPRFMPTPYELMPILRFFGKIFVTWKSIEIAIRLSPCHPPRPRPRAPGSRPHGASDVDGGLGAHRVGARAARADALRRRRAARAAPGLRRAAALGAAHCGGALRPAETWLRCFFWCCIVGGWKMMEDIYIYS